MYEEYETDADYARRRTRDLRVGDVVVWGERLDQRPTVAGVVKTHWRRYRVTLAHDGGQLSVLGRLPAGTVWWVLR